MVTFEHVPVLLEEFLEGIRPAEGENFVDGTGGGGGHARAVLERIGPHGHLLIMDQDPDALIVLRERFANEILSGQVRVISSNFSDMSHVIQENKEWIHPLAGIYADLGVSSYQLDTAARGFSLHQDGPLDMRMRPDSELMRADEWLAKVTLEELRQVLREYGEEPKAHEIAKAILRSRELAPIVSTRQLSSIISSAIHYSTKSRVHPATRSFQAIRIFINRELEVLESLMEQCPLLLAPAGRLGIITFHSLEDRIVKHRMQELVGKRGQDPQLRHLPISSLGTSDFELVKPFPLGPSDEEILQNPRSRSAKFRVIKRR